MPGLGALLAGCAVASAALDAQLTRRGASANRGPPAALAASLWLSQHTSLASTLGLAEVTLPLPLTLPLNLPLILTRVWRR